MIPDNTIVEFTIIDITLEDGTRLRSVPIGEGRSAWIDSENQNYYWIDIKNRKAVRMM